MNMNELLEECAKAAYEEFNSGLIGCAEDPWDQLPEDFKDRMRNATRAGIMLYLIHKYPQDVY